MLPAAVIEQTGVDVVHYPTFASEATCNEGNFKLYIHSPFILSQFSNFIMIFLYSLQNNVCITSNTSFLAVFCLHKVTKNTPSLDCPQLGVLYVHLHRAEGIAHGDPGESVDPNVRVYLNNQQVIY